jgi:hypothetical protein
MEADASNSHAYWAMPCRMHASELPCHQQLALALPAAHPSQLLPPCSLFKRVDGGLALMRQLMTDHAREAGRQLVLDPEKSKEPVEYVQQLLDELDKYEKIFVNAFNDDKTFRNALNQVSSAAHGRCACGMSVCAMIAALTFAGSLLLVLSKMLLAPSAACRVTNLEFEANERPLQLAYLWPTPLCALLLHRPLSTSST